MKRVVYVLIILLVSCSVSFGQETLSKKEKRLLKQEQEKKALTESIYKPSLRLIGKKFISNTGKLESARGGILYLKNGKGEFMEFWYTNEHNELKPLSTNFTIESYVVLPSSTKEKTLTTFSGLVKGDLWSFTLEVERKSKAVLEIRSAKGLNLKYDVKVNVY